ncbi:MAG: Lsr2 family protein [Umezawaea sp.]
MAQQTIVTLVDDIDGSEAHETVTFSLDGVQYEIDLSATHAEGLRTVLAEFVETGRRTSKPKGVRSGGGRSATAVRPAVADREQNQAIREWARSQGVDVADRGRISAEIVDKYKAAH